MFAEELAGPDDAWTPSLLSSAEPVPEPTILRVTDGPFLLRRRQVTLVHGLPGSAKTVLAYLGVVDAVERGETAMIIDHEMGRSSAGTMLRELGLTDAQIDTQVLHYDDPPPLTAKTQDRVLEACAGRDVSYVVIDALAGSMPSGASQNDAADVDAWFASTPKFFVKNLGAAVLVIDHSNKGDGPEPGGSVRKQGVPDLRMWLRLDKGFSKSHEDGRSTLIVQRDRSGTSGRGDHVAELHNELRDGRSLFVLRPAGSKPTATGDSIEVDLDAIPHPHRLRLDIVEALRFAVHEGRLTGQITGSGGAESQAKKKALDWLVKDGPVVWARDRTTAKGRRYWLREFAPGDLDG